MTFGQASASTQMFAAATVKISSSFHQYTGLRLASESLSRRGTQSELKLIYPRFPCVNFAMRYREPASGFLPASIVAPWVLRSSRKHQNNSGLPRSAKTLRSAHFRFGRADVLTGSRAETIVMHDIDDAP
jgi:hypothetical protein